MLLKILGIILGFIMLYGGIECVISPEFVTAEIADLVPVFIGATLLLTGIERFVFWLKSKEERDALQLVEAILGFLFGLLILCSGLMQTLMSVALIDLMTILIPMIVLSIGCIRITRGFDLRKVNKELMLAGKYRFRWGWEVVLGILLIIVGILSIFNPLNSIMSVGIVIGIDIMFCGMALIFTSLMI